MTPTISNAPSGSTPSYKWQLKAGDSWMSFGTGSTFAYLANRAESWTFRVTVTYGTGASVTSEEFTVTWTAAES